MSEGISFEQAKSQLISERGLKPVPTPKRIIKRGPPEERLSEQFANEAEKPSPSVAEPFKAAAKPEPLSRAELIRRDMEA